MKKSIYLLTFLLLVACSSGSDDSETPDPDSIVISGALSGIQSAATVDIGSTTINTSQSGSYSLEVENGAYTVIPSKDGFAFNPVGRTVNVNGSAQNNIDFTGAATQTTTAFSANWDLFNPMAVGISENTDTRLNLTMAQNALWFEGNQGGLAYQNVTGNFTFTATVSVRKTSDANAAVDCNICLGGLMARSADNRSGEDYVHIVSGNTPQGLGYETKNTNNSASPFEPISDGATDHELRICRDGSTFRLYQRAVGANTWNLAATYDRPDLPPTLQVGFNIYTAASGSVADLRVIYENVSLDTFSGSTGCQ
ncbi:hypothetical protein BFP97_16035 [Roseivirga sp. 4D4]|uniref:hypothetical protein n=1 Tax=Roseivirga sp. 4D4 TaxID=1889784 RepID=UPI000853EE21|nr:hypothetical protein [Roseivirga sp. 4D4]OEK02940.1 hypothetical protein BFP97_16035 [Roseivirga sp. 4D4]